MALEIERKFLVNPDSINELSGSMSDGEFIKQGYFAPDGDRSVRVRVSGKGAYITIKIGSGIQRKEYEYPIDYSDALEMLDELGPERTIEKRRCLVYVENTCYEVDFFSGELDGLVMAEVEIDSIDESISKPDWLGEEVTENHRYKNENLIGAFLTSCGKIV